MKHTVLICALLATFNVFSAVTWEGQKISSVYSANMTIPLNLDNRTFRIVSGTELKLLEIESLNMLKVYLHKYKVQDCPSRSLETDLELLQVGDKSVGVNLVRNCILEVYIERADYKASSFLE